MKLLKTLTALTIIPASYAASPALPETLTKSTTATVTAVTTETPSKIQSLSFRTLTGETLTIAVDLMLRSPTSKKHFLKRHKQEAYLIIL